MNDNIKALRARITELEDMLANLPLSSLQRLRTRIKQLEEMLAAVGAGGVGPLIPTTVQHQLKLSSGNHLQRNTGDSVTSCSTTPAGWKLVPVEPTDAMLDAVRTKGGPQAVGYAIAAWSDLLEAAPQYKGGAK